MLPPVIPVYCKNIIENHCTQPEHKEFLNITEVERRVVAVRLKRFPAKSFFIAEIAHVLGQNIPQESEFIAFVPIVCGDDHAVFKMKQ
jgi:hypothetical protein